MILDIAFEYSATIIPKGKRAEQAVTLGSSTSLEVAETSSAEAPVAAWWTPPHSSSLDGKEPGPRTAIRLLPDGLAQPVYRVGGAGGGEAFVRPGPNGEVPLGRADVVAGMHVDSFLAGHAWKPREKTDVHARKGDLPPGTRVVEDRESSMAAQIRKLLGGLVLVDGVLHRRVATPVLEADPYERRASIATLDRSAFIADPTMVYRLDQWDLAVSLGQRPSGRAQVPPPEVILPHAFAFDEARQMARGTAENIATMGNRGRDDRRPPLSRLPTRLLAAWVDVRDAANANGDTEVILRALGEFGEALAETPMGGLEAERAMVTRCLERTSAPQDDPDLAGFAP